MGKRLTAQEIIDTYSPGDLSANETKEEFWSKTLKAAQQPRQIYGGKSLYDEIQEKGQQQPIWLGTVHGPEITDGHHRLAVLHKLNPSQFVRYRLYGDPHSE